MPLDPGAIIVHDESVAPPPDAVVLTVHQALTAVTTAAIRQMLVGLGHEDASLIRRLSSRIVADPSGCWLWTGGTVPTGYGQLWVLAKKRPCGVHRIVYELLVGRIPAELVIDHLCRVRNCCNPAHLEPVTIGENVRRGEPGRNWSQRTHCGAGHEYTPENVMTRTDNGSRRCRICLKESNRRRLAKVTS